MKKITTSLLLIWLALTFLMLSTADLQAIEIKDVKFADRLVVDQVELQLTGVAVLKWAVFFDVYAGAFYLPAATAGQDWRDEVPRCLELSYFHAIAAADFGTSSDKLLRDSLAPAEYESLQVRLENFYRLFRAVQPGDRYRLIYRPGVGTELWFNQQLLGVAPGADFARAYFGIWLGEQPISTKFRDRLLGGS